MFFQKSIAQAEKEMRTDIFRGLSRKEVGIRLLKYGPNTIPSKPPPPLILHFIDQFKNLLVIILLLAALVSYILGDLTDTLAIFAIVIMNATIGAVQEIRAEKTLESLKEKDIFYTLVLRDKKVQRVPFSEIVIGDLLVLEEGE